MWTVSFHHQSCYHNWKLRNMCHDMKMHNQSRMLSIQVHRSAGAHVWGKLAPCCLHVWYTHAITDKTRQTVTVLVSSQVLRKSMCFMEKSTFWMCSRNFGTYYVIIVSLTDSCWLVTFIMSQFKLPQSQINSSTFNSIQFPTISERNVVALWSTSCGSLMRRLSSCVCNLHNNLEVYQTYHY